MKNTAGLAKINTATLRSMILVILAKSKAGLTRYEIAYKTKISLSSVCGRVNELMKDQRVFEDGKRLNPQSKVRVNILHAY